LHFFAARSFHSFLLLLLSLRQLQRSSSAIFPIIKIDSSKKDLRKSNNSIIHGVPK
jgi:hypothetical protein